MANIQNLVPFTSDQSREQAKINGSKGGKASGKVKRQRKAMQKQMELLLSLPFNLVDKEGNEVADTLATLGIEKKEIDNQMALLISLWKTAIGNGNQKIQAVREIREIVQDSQMLNKEDRVQIINDLPEDDTDDN